MPKTTLEALCRIGAAEIYDLDHSTKLEGKTIAEATEQVSAIITEKLTTIQNIKRYCIGVYDPSNASNRDKHLSEQLKEDHGRNGFISLVTVTRESIPADCFRKQYIMDQKEYAMILKKHLIEKFKRDKKLSEKGPDLDVADNAMEYVLYMTFGLEGNGYVLDADNVIKHQDINDAADETAKAIDKRMREIENKTGRKIGRFYIGKSYIRKRDDRTRFDEHNPNTWRADGVSERHRNHCKLGYGKNGLVVVAVITKESITEDCKECKYITHQEEYALTLERRLIQMYKLKTDKRLANKGIDSGKTDQHRSVGYVVYIAFELETRCIRTVSPGRGAADATMDYAPIPSPKMRSLIVDTLEMAASEIPETVPMEVQQSQDALPTVDNTLELTETPLPKETVPMEALQQSQDDPDILASSMSIVFEYFKSCGKTMPLLDTHPQHLSDTDKGSNESSLHSASTGNKESNGDSCENSEASNMYELPRTEHEVTTTGSWRSSDKDMTSCGDSEDEHAPSQMLQPFNKTHENFSTNGDEDMIPNEPYEDRYKGNNDGQ